MMKKLVIASLLALAIVPASAKKVKFAVDMGSDTISTFGIHISGDFQVLAGYQSDFCSDCTPLTQEGSTSIYSIVVDIPAFRKYEYKFLNGDQWYNAEFVPVESRIGYSFNDNRWVYVDSLGNDTTFVGAIRYAANAPVGKKLVRFFVDMQNETVSGKGVHVAGTHQAWAVAQNILYHFVDAPAGVYEVINYVTANSYQYKFYNGNSSSDTETVPSNCATSGNRSVLVSTDTLLSTVCYSSCTTCVSIGIAERYMNEPVTVWPNPATEVAAVEFKDDRSKAVVITDMNGKVVRRYDALSGKTLEVQKQDLVPGLYFLNVRYSDNSVSKAKLLFQ